MNPSDFDTLVKAIEEEFDQRFTGTTGWEKLLAPCAAEVAFRILQERGWQKVADSWGARMVLGLSTKSHPQEGE